MSSEKFKELKAYLQALPEDLPLSSPGTSGSGEDGSRHRHLIHPDALARPISKPWEFPECSIVLWSTMAMEIGPCYGSSMVC